MRYQLLTILISMFFATEEKPKTKLYGMVPLNDSVYVDDSEITNSEYREFLNALNSNERASYLQDTTVWHEVPLGESLTNYYHSHPAYDDYPAVGISYEAAIAFCKWRTEFYNSTNQGNVEFRLPSRDDWNLMSSSDNELIGEYAGGYSDPNNPITKLEQKESKKLRRKGMGLFNCKDFSDSISDGFLLTNPVYNNMPSNKIYGLSGNVAEMLGEEGSSVGGSWYHDIAYCRRDSTLSYDEPKMWLGFRCIAVMK